MTTTTYRTTTREERRLLSNAVARLRIAGCRVGHVIGHDLERGRLHYSVTLPGDDTSAGAMRIRMGHGRALRSPGIRVWSDPHDRGRLTFSSEDPSLMFHTLQALADVVNRFLPTPEPVGDSPADNYYTRELDTVLAPADDPDPDAVYRLKVTGERGETKWLRVTPDTLAALRDALANQPTD